MGLDMYLCGTAFLNKYDKSEQLVHNGLNVSDITYDIGYWRKHPNLHGFIVENFADCKDECQKIYLEPKDLLLLKDAVKEDKLPFTDGFFFGKSASVFSDDENEQKYAVEELQYTIKVLDDALDFLKNKTLIGNYREVYYQASW